MSDLLPTDNREISTSTTPKPSTHGWFWAVFVFLILVIILAAIAGYLLFQSKPGNGSGALSAADIRKLFSPNPTPTPTNTNPSATPTPTVSVTPTPTPSASATVSPTPSVTPSITPTPTPTPSPTEYVNQTLGFSMDLPNNWQATAGGDGQTIAFTSSTGQNGTVQSYAQTNETLDTIRQQLAGSQSVSNIVQTTYLGESALSFKIPGQGKQGIALIHNNRIYYIIAPSLIEPPFSSFSFM